MLDYYNDGYFEPAYNPPDFVVSVGAASDDAVRILDALRLQPFVVVHVYHEDDGDPYSYDVIMSNCLTDLHIDGPRTFTEIEPCISNMQPAAFPHGDGCYTFVFWLAKDTNESPPVYYVERGELVAYVPTFQKMLAALRDVVTTDDELPF